MDLLETIYTRRSIRKFKPDPISKDLIKKIIEAGLRAPSSKNSCPWYFLVLEGKEKDEVADWTIQNEDNRGTMPTSFETNEVPASIPDESKDTTNTSANIVKEAPLLVLIFNTAPYTVGRNYVVKNATEENIYTFLVEALGLGACMQNILLAAHALGLGALALADLYPAELRIKKKYNIDHEFAVGIAIGKPAYMPGKRAINPKNHLHQPL